MRRDGLLVTNPFLIDAGAPWPDRLGAITAPTLVLHGTEDPLFPLEHGRALAAEIPGARFLTMERTGHEVFPREVWDEVVPAPPRAWLGPVVTLPPAPPQAGPGPPGRVSSVRTVHGTDEAGGGRPRGRSEPRRR